MTNDQIARLLRLTQQVPKENRLDVEQTGHETYRVTEVTPELEVVRRFAGYIHAQTGGLIVSVEPDLSLTQLSVYEPILLSWLKKIESAEQAERAEFLIAKDGEYPELFLPLDTAPQNLAGNVREDVFPVWLSLHDALEQKGYRPYKSRIQGKPWEIWVQPLN